MSESSYQRVATVEPTRGSTEGITDLFRLDEAVFDWIRAATMRTPRVE